MYCIGTREEDCATFWMAVLRKAGDLECLIAIHSASPSTLTSSQLTTTATNGPVPVAKLSYKQTSARSVVLISLIRHSFSLFDMLAPLAACCR